MTAEVYLRAYLSPCINDCGIYGQCKLLRTNNYLYAACECKAGEITPLSPPARLPPGLLGGGFPAAPRGCCGVTAALLPAGWNGWGCTDNAEAFSYGFQLLSTLLLCLSNVMFVPPVAIAVRSHYLLEAAVYIFTMFFSTVSLDGGRGAGGGGWGGSAGWLSPPSVPSSLPQFYHACDQPGIVVFCIMDYDVLQFCDFLGSLMSVWVTVIAMARLQPVVKQASAGTGEGSPPTPPGGGRGTTLTPPHPQVLYLLGAMLLSMALQMDRHGLWNLLGPSLFALGIMAIAWVRTLGRIPNSGDGEEGGGHGCPCSSPPPTTLNSLPSPRRQLAPSAGATATPPPGSAGLSTCAPGR